MKLIRHLNKKGILGIWLFIFISLPFLCLYEDEDGRLDVDYKHSIDYYGYFDFNKCYSYSSSGGEFTPF